MSPYDKVRNPKVEELATVRVLFTAAQAGGALLHSGLGGERYNLKADRAEVHNRID